MLLMLLHQLYDICLLQQVMTSISLVRNQTHSSPCTPVCCVRRFSSWYCSCSLLWSDPATSDTSACTSSSDSRSDSTTLCCKTLSNEMLSDRVMSFVSVFQVKSVLCLGSGFCGLTIHKLVLLQNAYGAQFAFFSQTQIKDWVGVICSSN